MNELDATMYKLYKNYWTF